MCAFNQKGDLFKGCRFLSRKPYSLLKRKERKLRCIPGKFWFSRAILVYTVWTPQISSTSGYKWGPMNCNISTNIAVLLFPLAYFRTPWVSPPKCHQVIQENLCIQLHSFSPVLTSNIFIFIHFRSLSKSVPQEDAENVTLLLSLLLCHLVGPLFLA